MAKTEFDKLDDIDRLVGRRLRKARILRQVTQTDLARNLDVSYQAIQKYEFWKEPH